MISVLSEVRLLIRGIGIENVHAMHDVTEGGLIGGVYEMAVASNVGFEVFEDRIPILHETAIICNVLGVDPLRLIGSGALIASLNPEYAEQAIKILNKNGINAAIIGEFKRNKDKILVSKNGKKERIDDAPIDELWRFLD